MHILVTDDKSQIRESLTRFLTQQGHTVQTALNGLDGLGKSQLENFDLHIIDHLMPVMTGLQLCKNLKNLQSTANTPIFFMTTQAIGTVNEQEESELFSLLLAKPIDEELLLKGLIQLDKSNKHLSCLAS